MSLAILLDRASKLPFDAPLEEVHEVLGGLRISLAAGLQAHRAELRAFLTLADRFGSHADAWNAALLLDDTEGLDAHGKAMQASAWLRLFPESARSRPKTVLSLLGSDGRSDLSSAVLSGVLSRWLDSAYDSATRLGREEALTGTLLAASELAVCWWPEEDWATEAAGFASSFVDVTLALARNQLRTRTRENARLTHVFSTALLIRDARETNTEQALGLEEGVAQEADREAELATATVANLVHRLNASRRRIWVVGALQVKWEHLMGVAKSMGLSPHVFKHVGYNELKGRSLLERVDLIRDFGVLLGPIPHSVNELDGYSRLATQLRSEAGIGVVELRAQSESKELKISKTSFRSGLDRLLADAAVSGVMP